MYLTLSSLIRQTVERCNVELEAERNWCSDRCQTPAGGETASWGKREEGEGAAVGDQGELLCLCFLANKEKHDCYIRNHKFIQYCDIRIQIVHYELYILLFWKYIESKHRFRSKC